MDTRVEKEVHEQVEQEMGEYQDRHRKTTYQATLLGMVASTLTIVVIVTPGALWIARGALMTLLTDVVQAEVSGQVTQTVDTKLNEKVRPLNEGFKALLQQQINRLKREIAELERKQRAEGLTAQETRDLTDKRIDLNGQEAALRAIKEAEKA